MVHDITARCLHCLGWLQKQKTPRLKVGSHQPDELYGGSDGSRSPASSLNLLPGIDLNETLDAQVAAYLAQEQLQQSLNAPLGCNASSDLSTPQASTPSWGSSTPPEFSAPPQPFKVFKVVILPGHPTRSGAQLREGTPPSEPVAGTSQAL